MTEKRRKIPELLLPAGSPGVLKTAVLYGADAVYIGGESYGLRAGSRNFSLTEIKEAADFAHDRGCRIYVTANILAHEDDLEGMWDYISRLPDAGVDALLVADPGVFSLAREAAPSLPIHISTQANNTNSGTFRFWHAMGAQRVVAARELSLKELARIREKVPEQLQIEVFVHGAMCISYSGRCLLSNFLTGRDANKGECTHPCRWKYALMEESRPGEYMPVLEDERGSYIFNSGDLCMIDHIPDLIEAGADSLKVEGRMKTALYVASVGRAYRMALDDYARSPQLYRENIPKYLREVSSCTYRKYSTGFFYGKPSGDNQIYDSSTYLKPYTYLGTAEGCDERGLCGLTQKNKFSVGEEIEIIKPDGRNITARVLSMKDDEGGDMESCPHPAQHFYIDCGEDIQAGDILRRREV